MEAYQLFKARACGADAVLLIAAVLPNTDLAYLIKSVKKLGMQTLIEVCCHVCGLKVISRGRLCPDFLDGAIACDSAVLTFEGIGMLDICVPWTLAESTSWASGIH